MLVFLKTKISARTIRTNRLRMGPYVCKAFFREGMLFRETYCMLKRKVLVAESGTLQMQVPINSVLKLTIFNFKQV